MFKDFILNEVEKIAVVVAGLAGFKVANKSDEFIKLADTTLQNEYGIKLQELLDLNTDDFELWLQKQNYHADKLDVLAQLLYMHYEPFNTNPETLTALQKVIIIFDLLEKKHHRASFENINKRNTIYQFLQNNYE